ncbi:hypothetical protein ACJJIF_11980 [Microbulbifer sp. SSSA002]|uniref:hypothetical protein n=1 Tax=unclassified Microbulbifer TaxID=2619833 RepID=UPI0040398B14
MENLEVEFERLILQHLQSVESPFERELEKLVAGGFAASAEVFLIAYDSPHFDEDFPVFACAMESAKKFKGKSQRILSNEFEYVVVPSEIYNDEKYEDIEPWGSASRIVERWICERWKSASIELTKIPVVIGHHDSFFKIDVITGESVSWDAVVEKI